eukprot:1160237-Pelagomonas_calceolata.AAC.12
MRVCVRARVCVHARAIQQIFKALTFVLCSISCFSLPTVMPRNMGVKGSATGDRHRAIQSFFCLEGNQPHVCCCQRLAYPREDLHSH